MPKIGMGSAKLTRHYLPSGFKKLLIRTPSDIELLLMNNTRYTAELARGLSVKKRKVIIERAKELNVRITNSTARLKKVSAE